MSYQTYNFLHLVGVIAVFAGYGALLARAVLAPDNRPVRIWGAVLGGIGLLLLLVAGFGMQAKGGLGWPLWVILKILIWVVFGAALAFINRKPAWNRALWVLILALGLCAIWLGQFKPFA